MAVRSVLEIDVQDETFQRFQEAFGRYQDAVKALPGAWGKVNATATNAAEQFGDITAALLAQNELMRKAAAEGDRFGRTAHGTQTVMHAIAGQTRTIFRNVASVTKELLKWGSISAVFGGLLGAGGLFGLDRLAGAAASGRRSALGLGVSYGERAAFGVNFSRFVNPEQFLGGINAGATDVTSPEYRGMRSLGISQQEIASGNTAKIGVDVLRGLKQFVDRTPTQLLGPMLQAYGLSGLLSTEDARRLKATTPQEFQQQIQAYQRDRTAFEPQAEVLKRWQDLSTQLGRAGTKIETVLIDGLSGLSGPIMRLSQAFADAVSAFLKSPQVRQWIDTLSDGLQRFAAYISIPDFARNVQEFIASVGTIASGALALGKDIVAAVKWISDHLPSGTVAGAAVGAVVGGAIAGPAGAVAGAGIGAAIGGSPIGGTLPNAAEDWKKNPAVKTYTAPDVLPHWNDISKWWGAHAPAWLGGQSGPATPLPDQQMKKVKPVVDQLKKLGWSPEAAQGIAANVLRESQVNPNAVGDSGLAYGIGQWHPDRQADFRAAFGHDIHGSSLEEQVRFIDYELTHKEALAGHLLSTAKSAREVAAIISRYYERPADKEGEARRRAELAARIAASPAIGRQARQIPPQQPSITIRNQTGGSAIISAAALA